MTTGVFIVRFLVVMAAMLLAAVFGYMLARYQARQNNVMQVSIMSAEMMKMRRRIRSAQSEATAATSLLSKERRRQRRG